MQRYGIHVYVGLVTCQVDESCQTIRLTATQNTTLEPASAPTATNNSTANAATTHGDQNGADHIEGKKAKARTLVIALLSRQSTSHALTYGTRCQGSHSCTHTPMRLSANGMNYVSAFPAEAGPHFTDSRVMEG